ncbi:MAG: hypothetical protein AAF329_06815 [Cyanobacteria bacterium P01_A01_bin.17]
MTIDATAHRYFAHLHTVETIKSHYRKLAMEHHPDRGGNLAVTQEINRQYHEALQACDGQEREGRSYRYRAEIEQELMDKLLELLKLRSLDIALIGYWIWVSGDTKCNREALKEAGLKWHSKRRCWYYKPQGWARSRRSDGSLRELARKYGYKGFATADEENMPVPV